VYDRRRLAHGLALLALLAILASPLVASIVRTPAFHEYPDSSTALVLSNLPFLVVAALARGAPVYLRVSVAAIAVGSGAYHASPGDELLALDWAPIALTLTLLAATVIEQRIAFLLAPVLALGSVAFWLATGGTRSGGNMAPYVATQAAGVFVPPLIALLAPVRVRAPWLLAGVACFALARVAAAYDRQLLEAIGLSGHSIKHIVAALAAACALRATIPSRSATLKRQARQL
jgi:hypothetical protein